MHESNMFFKILIVDDVPENIKIVANLLKHEDYALFFATSGYDALEKVKSTAFDLILLDIMMSDIDGFEVCQRLKNSSATRDIPVIFLTAKTETDSLLKGFEVGGVDYVTKPFQGAELVARVKTHLELKRAREALQELNMTKDKFFFHHCA